MNLQTKAYLAAGLAVFFWSTVATVFKLSLRYLEPVQLVLLASIASTLVLFSILLLQGKLYLLRQLTRKTLLSCFVLGLLNPCLYYLTLFTAYDLLPAQQALAINYSWPVMLSILSIFLLKQRISLIELIFILVSYCGVVIIATRGNIVELHFTHPDGVALALFSTLIWALFWIFNVRQQQEPVVTLFLSFLFSVPVLLVFTAVFAPIVSVSWQGIVGAVYVGMFEMGITFLLWIHALKMSASTVKVSSLAFLSPFLSLVFISQFVGEEIAVSTLVGLAIVTTGIILEKLFSPDEESKTAGD